MSGLEPVLEVVRAHRAQSDRERMLAAPSVDALIDAGLFRLAVPAPLGGGGLAAPDILPVLAALARADVSAAWLVWNNLLPALIARGLEPGVRAELFANPAVVTANSTRAQGEALAEAGGWRVSGHWSLVSGCPAATDLCLLCRTEDGARFMFVPRHEVTIVDTWHTSGLRGTASHDVVVEGVLVDRARACSYLGPPLSADGPLDRFPTMALMAAGAAVMLLTLADIGVGQLAGLANAAVVTDGRPQAATRPALAVGLARAAADVRAAKALVCHALEAMWQTAAEGAAALPLASRGELFEAVDLARRNALRALRTAHELGGTAAVYNTQPLENAYRDALVMSQHVIFDPIWAEQAGRVRLGLAPTNPLFAN